MRFLLLIMMAATAAAQTKPEDLLTIRSRSEQFWVQGPRQVLPSPGYLNSPQRTNFVLLDQARVAVMCERVKECLLKELGAADPWKGRIFVSIYRAGDLGEPVVVNAQHVPAGWFYQVSLPGEIERARLVRTLVALLLREMADRKAGARPAELPPWLVPGMVAQLETVGGAGFILEDQTRTLRIERRIDPLAEIHRRLVGQTPLNLDELNWPTDAQLAGPPLGYYETCSQLFLFSLLRLPGGAECLRAMLDQAPQYLNWQTAFLKAFERHFKTLRDADKWWSLQIAGFTGQDSARTYNLKESWQKLEDILAAPVNLRHQTNELPERTSVPLQTVIAEWDFAHQKPLLRARVSQLQLLRLRISPELLTLTDDYRKTLQEYLDRRANAGFSPDFGGAVAASPRLLARKTKAQLDLLDEVRADLKNATLQKTEPNLEPRIEPRPPPRPEPRPKGRK